MNPNPPDDDDRDYHHLPSVQSSARIGGLCLLGAVLIFLLVALGGCTALKISTTERARGWPVLKPVVIEVNATTLQSVCGAFGVALQTHEACSLPMFSSDLCLVFVNPTTMHGTVPGDNASRLEHELAHCRGFEHVGGRDAAQLLAAYTLWTEYVEWRAAVCSGRQRTGDAPANLRAAYATWAEFKTCRSPS